MKYNLWNDYDFLSYDLKIKFDIRLQNVLKKLELFFENAKIKNYNQEKIVFYLAGSCIKKDTFRDIDLFIPTKEKLLDIKKNINSKYFLYENNSSSYQYDDDIIQIVYRERFSNKNISFMVDTFDFYSTKIAFKCHLDIKTFKIKILESDIRKEFYSYLLNNVNKLTRVNRNPFVSLQRAIHFLKRGDDVPFSVFLNICAKISLIDTKVDIEKYFDRLQGDEEKLKDIKEAITQYIIERRK